MDGLAYYVAVLPRELNCVIYSWDVQGSNPENRGVRANTSRLEVKGGYTSLKPFCDL
jgi:hypothetical protein